MQKVIVETTQNVNIDYSIASVGDRIVAFVIDTAIKAVYVIIGLILMLRFSINFDVALDYIYVGLFLLPFVFYFLIMELIFDGQSIGKKIMRIKVIKMDGSQPDIGEYILRWLLRIVDSFFGYGVGLITIILNGQGQRLGDVVAGTSVIKLNKEEDVSYHKHIDTPEEDYEPVFPHVERLSDHDIETIKQALNFYKESGVPKPVIAAANKVKEVLNIESELPPTKLLNVVVKDYNHVTGKLPDSW
jgi:uncharacterized RDD family membrane protein YckC